MTDDDRLTDLLVAWEEAVERGEKPNAAELCRARPDLAGRFTALLRTLGKVKEALEDTVPSQDPGERGPLPRLLGRYRLRRLLGHGGLGDVYGAEDTELPREVAVKLIRGAAHLAPEYRRRFAHEAAITSQLDHPGVVPVHGYNAPETDTPYYAMRLIRGRSLHEEIETFHMGMSQRAPEESQRELRRLLRSFVAACQTIAFAHSRGVLHRDIKPQNIMVGPYGETLVVDWGLAKQIDSATDVADAAATHLAPLATRGEGQTGAVGTLEYMSPEQYQGEATVQSDIFSLGATLWKILAGASRLPDLSDYDRLRLVARGHYAPPEKVRPGTPPGLSAICRKALAADPYDRYQTVTELVDEVEAWLADEPVRAFPDPWWVAARRWAVRNMPYVTAAGGLLAAAALALGIITILVRAHNDQLAANYDLAHKATRNMAIVAIQDLRWEDFSQNPLRREILTQTTNYYRQALALQGDSPEVRRELAQATLCLGLTEHFLSESSANLGSDMKQVVNQPLLDAAAQYRVLAEQHPDDLDLVYGKLASAHLVGMANYDFHRDAEALPLLSEVYQGLEQLDFDAVPKEGTLRVRTIIARVIGEPPVVQADTAIYLSKLAERGAAPGREERIRLWGRQTRLRLEKLLDAAGGQQADLRIALAGLYLRAASDALRQQNEAGFARELTVAAKHLLETPPEQRRDVRHRFLELQIRLGLVEAAWRAGRKEDSLAEVDQVLARAAQIVERMEAIVSYEFLPPHETYQALRQLVAIVVRADVQERKASDDAPERGARQMRRLRMVAPILPQLAQHLPKLAADDPELPALARDCAAALEAWGLHAEAGAVMKSIQYRPATLNRE